MENGKYLNNVLKECKKGDFLRCIEVRREDEKFELGASYVVLEYYGEYYISDQNYHLRKDSFSYFQKVKEYKELYDFNTGQYLEAERDCALFTKGKKYYYYENNLNNEDSHGYKGFLVSDNGKAIFGSLNKFAKGE